MPNSKNYVMDGKVLRQLLPQGDINTSLDASGNIVLKLNDTLTNSTADKLGFLSSTARSYLLGVTSTTTGQKPVYNSAVYATNGALYATTFYGSGAGLTSIPAANLTGTASVNTTGDAGSVGGKKPADFATAAQGTKADNAVPVSSIVNNLSSSATNVPLSAAQGKLINDRMPVLLFSWTGTNADNYQLFTNKSTIIGNYQYITITGTTNGSGGSITLTRDDFLSYSNFFIIATVSTSGINLIRFVSGGSTTGDLKVTNMNFGYNGSTTVYTAPTVRVRMLGFNL